MEVTKTELLRDAAKYFDEVEKTGKKLRVIDVENVVFELCCVKNHPSQRRMTMKEIQEWYAQEKERRGLPPLDSEISEEELFQPMTDDWEVLKEDDRNPWYG